MSYNDPNN